MIRVYHNPELNNSIWISWSPTIEMDICDKHGGLIRAPPNAETQMAREMLKQYYRLRRRPLYVYIAPANMNRRVVSEVDWMELCIRPNNVREKDMTLYIRMNKEQYLQYLIDKEIVHKADVTSETYRQEFLL